MLTASRVAVNNAAWEVFFRAADAVLVVSPDDIQNCFNIELRKSHSFRLFSVRTKHDYKTGRLVAFAVAYGDMVDDIRRDVFIADTASKSDIAELKYRCGADFEEARVAA